MVNPAPRIGVRADAWDSLTGIELDCLKLVEPDTLCGGKVFSKNLHFLHWPKLSEETSSFGEQCTFGKSLLHCCCTICTICPRWRESDPLLAGSGFRPVSVKRVPVTKYGPGYFG